MRALVVGGTGQIGAELCRLAPEGAQIFCPPSSMLDIRDAAEVSNAVRDINPEVVINAAAYTAVDKAEVERELAFAVNADGAGNVARACVAEGARLVHLSTDYVFDGTAGEAYSERDSTHPINAYGESKLAGERQIIESGASAFILRVAWVYGRVGTNFVKTMLRMADREAIRVVNDQRGTPCAADDIAAFVWKHWMDVGATDGPQLVHFASTPATTWFEFANSIFRFALELGLIARVPVVVPIDTEGYPTPARRPANSVLDSNKLQRLVGFVPSDWRISLRRTLSEIARDNAQ